MRPVNIEVIQNGDVAVLDIDGEVRIGQPTVLLRNESKRLLEEGQRLFVLDMLDVPWLDSSGLGEVFACYKRAREVDGVVKLVLRGKAYTLFTITRLDKVFEIFGNAEAALASFRDS
jgi:anti-sigma B factor antagonist